MRLNEWSSGLLNGNTEENTDTRQDIWPQIRQWLPGIILLGILLLAAWLRLTGLNWDEFTHLHPDERFLTMVETSISPTGLDEYFDTANSPLSPYNNGFGFFVYGTFPIFLVRYVAEWISRTGYDEIHLVGRSLSALFDLASIALLYAIGTRLYSKRVGLLAAFFLATSVLLIQHAHFFVVDPIANLFVLTGFYFAVRALDDRKLTDYLMFGLSLGLAVASKINTAPLAGVIVLAGLVYLYKAPEDRRIDELVRIVGLWVLAGITSLVVFRIFQPYAFQGPSIFGVQLNPQWLGNMREIASLNSGNTDAPYALQWANRTPVLFSLRNMLLWGLGLPLGIAAWLSWGWALIEMFRGRWERHLLPVVWTGAYFLWQSTGFTPAMRYQLPVYPTLVLLAAWGLWELWDRSGSWQSRYPTLLRVGAGIVAAVVVLGTLAWALAFTSIYREPFTRSTASRWVYQNIPGILSLKVHTEDGDLFETPAMPSNFNLSAGGSYTVEINSTLSGDAFAILMPYVSTPGSDPIPSSINIQLLAQPSDENPIATASFQGDLSESARPVELELDTPMPLTPDDPVYLRIDNTGGNLLQMRGSTIIQETTWDDGIPWGVDGKNVGGRYETRNLELYWHDDQDDNQDGVSDKLERIITSLSEGDYLTISSNRQYGTIPRVPVRYPLTSAYYQALLGCPDISDIISCYAQAEVGDLEGLLGYTLVAVFDSHPHLGPLEINDQFAEETFTIYDHPKVFIFKKDADFSEENVEKVLGDVDLSRVVHVLPKDADRPPKDLLLPLDRWNEMQTSGTWSELFDADNFINKYPFVAVVLWWLAIGILGVITLPITRAAFFGLQDGGYPLSRLVGLLILAWGSWMLGSLGIPVSRGTILLVLLGILLVSVLIAWRYRLEIRGYFQEHKREILFVELLALGFFIFDLLIRFGNPDLWHPAYGGEKPMDFSYLNAVIKSSTFPPYDPWFAGGYINYYYYGFVLVGIPIKLLGIMPSLAYNIVIPTLFSLLALSAYCVGSNLVALPKKFLGRLRPPDPRLAGTAAAIILVVLGNLGTARMFYEGFKHIGAPSPAETGTFVTGVAQAARGLGEYVLQGERMPYPLHQWYWNPSRAIEPGEGEAGPITEFPFFTFIYGDLHAHMISRPLTVMTLAWALSWLLSAEDRARRRWTDIAMAMIVGGLAFGALRPTNTWDFPVYWVLGVLALVYAVWLRYRKFGLQEILEAVATVGGMLLLAQFLYQPYHDWYGQGYEAVEQWKGSLTPLIDYLTVHGLFLFVITTWMMWETYRWMDETPISALSRLKPYAGVMGVGALFLIFGTFLLVGLGYSVVLFVIPLGIWSLFLLLRTTQPVGKQMALFMVGTGLMLTLLVEVIVLRGDISRMNTVFKFYLQVWELFSIASAAAIAWVVVDLPDWRPTLRWIWTAVLTVLLISAALFPLLAGAAKVRDRMTITAPRTLDGMRYMAYADNHFDLGERIDLPSDYQAIRWMQDNVEGSPVIVEANTPEYRWGSRYTIYTGLPSVLGWRWHQSQQRVAAPNSNVDQRLFDITEFYLTQSIQEAIDFLDKYQVEYVILGSLERAYYEEVSPCRPLGDEIGVTCELSGYPMGMPTIYDDIPVSICRPIEGTNENAGLICPTNGLLKFDRMVAEGILEEVFRNEGTIIYKVSG